MENRQAQEKAEARLLHPPVAVLSQQRAWRTLTIACASVLNRILYATTRTRVRKKKPQVW